MLQLCHCCLHFRCPVSKMALGGTQRYPPNVGLPQWHLALLLVQCHVAASWWIDTGIQNNLPDLPVWEFSTVHEYDNMYESIKNIHTSDLDFFVQNSPQKFLVVRWWIPEPPNGSETLWAPWEPLPNCPRLQKKQPVADGFSWFLIHPSWSQLCNTAVYCRCIPFLSPTWCAFSKVTTFQRVEPLSNKTHPKNQSTDF